jgi:hypothetical protein
MLREQGPTGSERNSELWERGVALLAREYSLLNGRRRDELAALLAGVGRLKEELVALSDAADGSAICAACGGACCRVGKYHPTLLDLLAFCAAAENAVAPDFTSGACPFLGSTGCRITPSRRPFTCVIFICELIEVRLPEDTVVRLHNVEEELRLLHEQATTRFGRLLAKSLLLEMELSDQGGPFLIQTTD